MMWDRTLLSCLVEAFEVPGDMLGDKVRLNRPANSRLDSAAHAEDEFMLVIQSCHQQGFALAEAPQPGSSARAAPARLNCDAA